MLDPRARKAILDYQAGACGLEVAAQVLIRVRRETGCLELHQPPAMYALLTEAVSRR